MGIRNFPCISPGDKLGVNQSVAAAGQKAIPVMGNGALPKFLYVLATGPAGGLMSVSPTIGANGAFATGLPLFFDNPIGVILNVHGFTHIGYEDDGATVGTLWLTPLEDF
jgi:hypothetical protein